MRLFRGFSITVMCSIVSFLSFAQSGVNSSATAGQLTGQLVDGQNKPVSYATVTLFRKDSSVVNGDLTKDDGSFNIVNTGIGVFRLRITAIGFSDRNINDIQITAAAPEKNMGPIKLSASSQTLKEVQVTGERAMMEMSVDKKTFNVEKNITSAGGSAGDVLQNVPSVSVDVDGNVSLRGKDNVTILIDGKPATMFGGDVASALQSLPASSIESVEVITNPSAKYDAQGVTGIINIITKRDKKFGFNGTVTLGAGTRDKYNGNLGLNARNNKWNFFLNSSFRFNANASLTTTNRTSNIYDSLHQAFDKSIVSEDYLRHFNGSFNTIGAEYTINKNNTITFTQNVNIMEFENSGYANYTTYANAWDAVQMRYADGHGGPLSLSSSLDYKHKFKKPKQEITANVTGAKMWITRAQEYNSRNTVRTASGQDSVIFQSVQIAPSSGSNASLNAQVDFTTPFLTKNGKLDAGAKTQLVWFESSNNPSFVSPTEVKTFDTVLYSAYKYNQQTHAAYASFSDQEGKFSYSLGLRMEDAEYSGTNNNLHTGSEDKFSTSFLNFFPSVFLSYQLPKQQSIYLSYTRRTNRPGFRQMLPYKDVSNPQDTTSGNPDLIPEFIHSTELSYNKTSDKGDNIILSTYYQYTENIIQSYRQSYSQGTTYTRPENLKYGITYGLELIGHVQIIPAWDATLNLNYFQNEINGDNIKSDSLTHSLNNKGNSWFGKMNTSIKLPKGFSLQINGNYEAPKVVAQGNLKESYWMDVAVRKNLWKNKATLVFNVSDVFNTHKYTQDYNLSYYTQTIYRNRETRIGNVTFTYRFGKTDNNKPDMGKSSSGFGGSKRGQDKGKDKGNQSQQAKDRDGNLKSDEGGDNQGGGPQGGPGGGTPQPQQGGSH
ncbi:MAG: TonB-dependent receptor [Bacteroidota bacterium]